MGLRGLLESTLGGGAEKTSSKTKMRENEKKKKLKNKT